MTRVVVVLLVLIGQPTSPTHVVTPDGSQMSTCTPDEPCSLPRAVALASANLLIGADVEVREGWYNQPRLTLSGRGTTFRFSPGATMTGGVIKPATWTPVDGYPRTYATDVPFVVGLVAQRQPSTWRPIRVEDRLPPFEVSLGRWFDLDQPVKFKPAASIALVDAQSGTYHHESGRLYVHAYHDGPIIDADDLYIGPSHHGSLLVTGSGHTLEGLTIRQTTGTGLWVQTSARDIDVRNLRAVNSQVWIEGGNTLLEGADISHVIAQGVPTGSQCYDANPSFGVGECWNAGGSGNALLIGRAGRPQTLAQIVRDVKVHRSWNGVRIDGQNTVERLRVWGMPNHALEASGRGVVLRRAEVLNAQDSLYTSREDVGDWTIEGNIFVNAVFITSSNVTPAGPIVFRRNIVPVLTVDRSVERALQSECNVWMEDGSALFRILAGAVPGVTYTTLSQLQQATPHDQMSRARRQSLATGGPFDHYTTQADEANDFGDPLEVCGERAGR
jgi:hypothetical protein